MVEKVTYKPASIGVEINLSGENGVYIETFPNLRSGEWTYKQRGKMLQARSRQTRTEEITLKTQTPELLDMFLEMCDADVENNTAGTLCVDDWQAQVFIVKDKATTIKPNFYEVTLTVLLTEGVWRKPHTYSYVMDNLKGSGLNYPHTYPFDYSRSDVSSRIWLETFTPLPMDLTIFGSVSNPRINIAGNTYALDVDIKLGERVEVDSLNNTVTLISSTGERRSVISNAYFTRDMNIFAPLPRSGGAVTWNNNFNFDVTVWKENGRAPWA